MTDLWNDDKIQFARLLYEIELTQNLDYEALEQEMDLDTEELDELFERARTTIDEVKKNI
jgi:hypothetical protein